MKTTIGVKENPQGVIETLGLNIQDNQTTLNKRQVARMSNYINKIINKSNQGDREKKKTRTKYSCEHR